MGLMEMLTSALMSGIYPVEKSGHTSSEQNNCYFIFKLVAKKPMLGILYLRKIP